MLATLEGTGAACAGADAPIALKPAMPSAAKKILLILQTS
jgi:hypothetical protein